MELHVHEDKITGLMGRLKGREAGRASEAGEDREAIGSMLELTGLNKKAFSFVRALDKLDDDKRDDVLRSLTPLLELMQPHWDGQSTPDMLDAADEDDEDDPQDVDPIDFGDDEETKEFNAAVDENVVTPFSAGAA